MTEEELREQYRAIAPDGVLKGRVLAACRAAKKKRTARSRRIASAAACLAVVLALSVYGLSPVPGVSCGGQAVGSAAVTVLGEAIIVQPEGEDGITSFSLERSAPGGVLAEDCIPVTLDRAAAITAADGPLYLVDPLTGAASAVESGCALEAGSTIYWQPRGDSGTLTVRAGLRALTLRAVRGDGGWIVSR